MNGFLPRGTGLCLAVVAVLGSPGMTAAQDGGTEPRDSLASFSLEPIVVEGRGDDLTGIAVSASQGFVGYRDFKLRPLLREGELLETVPGLIMTQHSGDGKSNQMFVRGFNLDHGTDFATAVEGIPLNIPTHAHGQGYTDLNFIIPELVELVEYRLGPYYADIGDFGSAGGANLKFRRSLDRPLLVMGTGEDGYIRSVAAGSMEIGPGQLLAGGEMKGYDGPWDIDEDLRKRSGMARYSWESARNAFSILAIGYDNRWNASDQVPQRLMESGGLGRFAQVDSTLGGASSRYALAASWAHLGSATSHRVQIYGMRYDLDLFSNFTYFLDDPDEGDQIQQRDRARKILGGAYKYVRTMGQHEVRAGLQSRLDLADVALRHTNRRKFRETVRADEVTEWGTGLYFELQSTWTPKLRTVLGIRGDAYRFDVHSDRPENSGVASDAILSPKLSVMFEPWAGTEIYMSGGYGFHSNDARGTIQSVDPASGEEVEPVDPLARSLGGEVGFRTSPVENWRSTFTLWTVELESELLFVGDAGTTEPSDASRRTGITWSNFWRATPELRIDLDASFARARFHELPDGEDRIPGALEQVVTAGGAWEPEGDGPYAALRFRHFGRYPLIEDNSVRAAGTSLLNLNLGWVLGDVRIGASVTNLLDSADADIAYFYGSRVAGEPATGVEDVHFHPVEPRRVRLTLSWGY